jgi:hypothetical protein
MKPLEYGQFRVEQLKKDKEDKKTEPKANDLEAQFPDLKIFEDCRKMADQLEIVIARP